MKKFKTINGETLNIGDKINMQINSDFYNIKIDGKLVPEVADILVSLSAIFKNTESTNSNDEYLDINFYIIRLATKYQWNPENMYVYIKYLLSISPAAAISIILKEIALYLDEKYMDHISKSEEIWAISSLNDKIFKIRDREKIKTFKSFAAFRNKKDALLARIIINPIINHLYN